MRNFRLRIFVLICICITSVSTFAKEQLIEVINDMNVIKLKYSFDVPQIKTLNGVSSVLVKGLDGVGNPGDPLLPLLSSQIILPQGASVKFFSVVGKAIDVEGNFVVEHAEFAQPLSSFDKTLVTPQNTKIYDLKSAYPAQLGYAKDVGKKFGYSILPFNLNPVSYIPADGKISYYKELNVLIELTYDKNLAAGALSADPTAEQLNDISAITDDTSSVKTYSVSKSVKKQVALSSASIDYVLVVPDSFDASTINTLISYHELYNNYSVTNITLDWIDSNYSGDMPSGGSDLQTKIREFITDAYAQWGTRFVMLVGDESIIPSRKLHAEVNGGADVADIPADLYFGCLDGTFDDNLNGIYGEPDDGASGGEVDLYAEVYVGRAAVSDTDEFANLVNKIVSYETADDDYYLREVHMLGEYLRFGGISDYAKGMMEQIRLGGTYDGYTTKGFADSKFSSRYDLDVNLYDADAVWADTDLLTLMNDGSHLFNHLGHANSTYNMKLNTSDLNGLTNDKYFFVYSQGCMAGWFDDLSVECFAQKITSIESGAFGVIMNARYGWGSYNSTDGPSQRFARWFWDYGLGNYDKIINGGNLLEPGVANQLSKEILAPQINGNCMRWITYELNLFGDAAAPLRLEDVVSRFTMTDLYINSTNLLEVGIIDPNLVASNLTVTIECYDDFISLSDRGTLLSSTSLDLPFDSTSETFKTNVILDDILSPSPTDDNTVVFTYSDLENPLFPSSVYYLVGIDNTPPTVSDILVDNITIDASRINFSTDEPVAGNVLYGEFLPPWFSAVVIINTVVNPETGLIDNPVNLGGLDDETVYCFAIVVEDKAKNVTSIPINVTSSNPDDYNKFVTAGLRWGEIYSFEQDGPLGWIHGGLNDTWEFGKVLGSSETEWATDGWQTGLNSPYVLPCNTWLASPFISSTDIHYVAITYELDIVYGSTALLEGYDGDGWHTLSVMPQTYKYTYMFDISALDTSKPFKLRCRLLSQTGVISARGLSVFDMELRKEIKNAIYIENIEILDTLDLSPNNNNNTILDAGETVNIRITSKNLTQNIVSNVVGTIDLPSPNLDIIGGNTVSYGNMEIGERVVGSGYIKVVASINYNPEAETSYLLQTASSVGTSARWVDKTRLDVVGNVAAITGKVVDKSGVAIGGAIVNIASEPDIISLVDGTFTSTKKYEIGRDITVIADANDFTETIFKGEVEGTNYIEMVLGKAYLDVSTSSLNFTVKPGSYTNAEFTVSNSSIVGDSDLSFDIPDYEDDSFVISFEADDSVLAQGESTKVEVEIFTKQVFEFNDAVIPVSIVTYEKSYLTQSGTAATVTMNLDFESYNVSGVIYDKQSNTVENVDIYCEQLSRYVTTGTNGVYSFDELAPNTYQFYIQSANDEFLEYKFMVTITDSSVVQDIVLGRAYAKIQNAHPMNFDLDRGQSVNVVLDIANISPSYTADSDVEYIIKAPVFTNGYLAIKFDKTTDVIAPLGTDQVVMRITSSQNFSTNYFYTEIVDAKTGFLLDTLEVDVLVVSTNIGSYLQFVGYEVLDDTTNGVVEVGETFELLASLSNVSPTGLDATDIVVSMSVVSGPATMVSDVTYPNICSAGAAILPLTNSVFTVGLGASVGDIITLNMHYDWSDSSMGPQSADMLISIEVGLIENVYFDPSSIYSVIYEGDTIPLSVNLFNDSDIDKDFSLSVKFEEGKIIDETEQFIPIKINWTALNQRLVVPNRLLIRPKANENIKQLKFRLIKAGYKIKAEYSLVPGLLVELPEQEALSTSAQTLETWNEVLYVEPEYIRTLNRQIDTIYRKQSDDYYAHYLWGLYNDGSNFETALFPLDGDRKGTPYEDINAREAWYITTGSKDVKVCIMDTGIYRLHEDLRDNLWINQGEIGLDADGNDKSTNGIDDDNNGAVDDVNGADFVQTVPNGNYSDLVVGHGTHVSGTIGAVGNNDIGVVGVNWNVSLVGAKIDDEYGNLSSAAEYKAIEYCAVNDIDVVNMSFGGSYYSGFEYELMRAAGESNVLFICSAGNSALDNDVPDTAYPCSYDLDNIISVAAHDNNGFLANFSNYGEVSVDISAPGVDIFSTFPVPLQPAAYTNWSGTSMAAPQVAGVAAMLKSVAPDAPYTFLRQAILDSAVKSHKLTGKVSTSGYLNAYDAVHLMKTYWVELLSEQTSILANNSSSIDFILNPNKNIVAGEQYKASIVAVDSISGDKISLPITIMVIPSIVLEINDVDVSGGNGNDIIEPGETVSLTPYMLNNGSMLLQNGITVDSITFSDPGVTYTGSLTWNSYLEAAESQASSTPISVTFPTSVGSTVTMSVTVKYNEDGRGVQTHVVDYDLSVEAIDRYSVSGVVVDSVLGVNIDNATVQYFGQNTGFVKTDINGNFEINEVGNGDLSLKVYKSGYAVSEQIKVYVGSGDVTGITFDIVKPTANIVVSTQNIKVLKGNETNVTVAVYNTSNYDWKTPVTLFRKPRIALISDGSQLESVAPIVEGMGYDCDILNDNVNHSYTLDSGVLSKYDVIVLHLTGEDSSGRVLTLAEEGVLQDYKYRRGSIIITGANPFNSPDNYYMAALLNNVVNNGLQEDTASIGKVYSNTRPVDSFFGKIPSGSKVAVATKNYGNILVNSYFTSASDHNSAVDNLVTVNGATKIAYFDGETNLKFGNYVWTGNESGLEWVTPNILQDVFKNILLELAELRIEDEAVINGGSGILNLAAGASTTITLTFKAQNLYDNFSTNNYTLLFANGLPIESYSKVLDFEVIAEPFRFTAGALGGVTNWLGEALQGDGSDNSSIYQLIYAGADGVPNEPATDGGTTGDDDIVLRSFDGTSFGYFGYGIFAYPDKGRFVDEFAASLLSSGDKVYVRAWDGSSIAASVAYGNSPLYTVNYAVDEQYDFYAWAVGSVLNYPGTYGMQPVDLADKNADSIVDGFAVKYGFKAKDPIEALETGWSDNAIVTSEGLGDPTRLVVANGYVYVTVSDPQNHHISIYDEDLSLIKTYSNASSPFDNPQGISFDEVNSNLIVADTDNNRIVALRVQDGTNLTWLGSIGSGGDGNGQFNRPYDVAVGVGSKVYVADSRFDVYSAECNNRVSVFSDGQFDINIGTVEASALVGKFNKPLGVTFDDSGFMYVADYANERIQCLTSTGTYLWKLDLPGVSSKWVNGAQDLSVVSYQYNGVIIKTRLFIADYNNSCVLVYGMKPATFGQLEYETTLGMSGGQPGDLDHPQGIFVSDGSAYIADTGNDRVQKLDIILDIDQDGMEDTWEDVNGLDSTVNDALLDPDGDGLYNIGEFRIHTEPMNRDTDGDGMSDGEETVLGSMPWVVDSLIITAVIGGNGSLSFPAIAGGTYRLEYTVGLINMNWQDGGTYTALTDGVLTIPNLPGWGVNPMTFYRVIWTNPNL